MGNWNKLASLEATNKTRESLIENGMQCYIVENKKEAKEKALELLPLGVEVMDMTSETLKAISLVEEINESGRFDSLRGKLAVMEKNGQDQEKKRSGAAPKWAIGSVHAITETGEVFIASNTGSQLPAYAYGSDHIIWVVGTQKIVKGRAAAFRRIYDYCLPLESERAKKAYGVPGSFVSKILIVKREVQQERITVILVKEVLGF